MDEKKEIFNDVRQVLMNELGLTRAVIREEMEKIVKDTIEKHFNSGYVDGKIAVAVENKLGQILKNGEWYSFEALKSRVEKQVAVQFDKFLQKEVKEKITSKIKVTMDCTMKEG